MAGAAGKRQIEEESMGEVSVTWVQGKQFVSSGSGGHSIVLDAPDGRETWQGFKPSELLLVALAGCTAVDTIEILHKKRQAVSGLSIRVQGEQQADPPWAFTAIHLHYEVRGRQVDAQAVERAIELSQTKYCSVAATVRGVATIQTSFTILEDEVTETAGARELAVV
jgi:putative redox protein